MLGDDALLGQLLEICLFGGLLGLTGGHDAVVLGVDQCVEFHKAVGVLEHHDIGGLTLDIDERGERGIVALLLHLTLGGAHSGIFLGTDDRIVLILPRAGVGDDETDVGLVAGNRGHAGEVPHVVIADDIAVAVGGDAAVLLTDDRVPEAARQGAVPVVLLAGQSTVVDVVHPCGGIGHFHEFGFTGAGVEDDDLIHVHRPEQPHAGFHARDNVAGLTLVVDFKINGGKNLGGVGETEFTHEVLAKESAVHIADGLVEFDVLGRVIHGVNHDISGNACDRVVDPTEEVGILEVGDLLGGVFVVDLVVIEAEFVLRDHVREVAQHALADDGSRCGIHEGDVADDVRLGHIRGKDRVGDVVFDDIRVSNGIEERGRDDTAHDQHRHGNGGNGDENLIDIGLHGEITTVCAAAGRTISLSGGGVRHHAEGQAVEENDRHKIHPKSRAVHIQRGEDEVVGQRGQDGTDDDRQDDAGGFFHSCFMLKARAVSDLLSGCDNIIAQSQQVVK